MKRNHFLQLIIILAVLFLCAGSQSGTDSGGGSSSLG